MNDNVVIVLQPIAIGQPVAYDQELNGIRPARAELYEPMLGVAIRALLVGQQLDKKTLFEGTGPVSRKTESDKVVPSIEPGVSRKELRAMIREIAEEVLKGMLEKTSGGVELLGNPIPTPTTEAPVSTEEPPKE